MSTGAGASAAILTVTLPAMAALLGLPGVAGRTRTLAREVAVVGTAGALIAALVEFAWVTQRGPVSVIGFGGRVALGDVVLGLNLTADQLSATMALAVALVALCVQIYSAAYLRDDPRYRGYTVTVSLFTAAMMLVVHAEDLISLLIGWEVMGVCSYLLIGHHSERPAARRAAVKAFLMTRVGDVGVLIAIALLVVAAHTASISTLGTLAGTDVLAEVLTPVCLLLLLGVAGKSAQFPLHAWLPDAMEGPTPISALIHAATMVAAGVFLVIRMLPLFLESPTAMLTGAAMAAITMIGGAFAALVATDLKRVLAWSTVSQVAMMLGAVCVATTAAGAAPALAHLLSHAAFKALLFLSAGAIITVLGTGDLIRIGNGTTGRMLGLPRSYPGLALVFGLGLAALAGVPPTSGFWSKDAVLGAAWESAREGHTTGRVVLAASVVTIVLTAAYCARLAVLVLTSPTGVTSPDQAGEDPEPATASVRLSAAITGPLYVLAVPTVALGLFFATGPSVVQGLHIAWDSVVLSLILIGLGVLWVARSARCGVRDASQRVPAVLRRFAVSSFGADPVLAALREPGRGLARTASFLDHTVIDAYVRSAAISAWFSGGLLRRTQRGLATGYLLWVVAGGLAAVLIGVIAQ